MNSKGKIAIFIISLISALMMYLSFLFKRNAVTEILSIMSLAIISVIIIPQVFNFVLNFKSLKEYHYNLIHLVYILMPVGLIGQYNIFEEYCIVIVSFLITIITTIFVYYKLKKISIVHLRHLKYSNLFLSTIFTITITLIGLITDSFETILILLYISPLLVLQTIYEKISLQIE